MILTPTTIDKWPPRGHFVMSATEHSNSSKLAFSINNILFVIYLRYLPLHMS